MNAQWANFISTLSTDELENQLADILSFAREYQQLAADELNKRNRPVSIKGLMPDALADSSKSNYVFTNGKDIDDEENFDEIADICTNESSLDYYTSTRIQQAVESYGEDELQDRINEINEALKKPLTDDARATILYEKELCEFHLSIIHGEEEQSDDSYTESDAAISSNVCRNCGADLHSATIFCPKCGTRR